ncbi:hypothetical protein ACP4OV_002476 [Aristida adscensionis]
MGWNRTNPNVGDGSQGPCPGWNSFMYPYPCPPNWLPPGYQQVPMMCPNGPQVNQPQVIQPPDMAVPLDPTNEEDSDILEVPPPTSAKEKSKKGGTRSKLGNFSPEEDVNIVRSWLEISCDAAIGTGQKRDRMWDRIMLRYNMRRGSYPERTLRSIQSHWDIIKSEVAKFSSLYADTVRENPSGNSDADMTTRAAANFASSKRNFTFMHCWELMKDEPKWQDPKVREIAREAGGSGFGDDDIHAGGSSPAGTGGSRPLGRDSAKAAKKNATSSPGSSVSSEWSARMQDLSLKKISIMEEETVRKNERFQQLTTFDEKRLRKC